MLSLLRSSRGLTPNPQKLPPQQRHPPAINPPGNPASSEKQYLRLPIDSARKLRWYDKGDVATMVKTHVREKHELLDTIAALKKTVLRSGITEAGLDSEVRHLLLRAENISEADEGVYSVLLTAATTEMEALQVSNASLTQRMEDMQDRIRAMESELSTAARPGAPVPPLQPELASRLGAALELFDRCQAGSALLARQMRSQEQDIVVREAVESMRMLMASSSAAAASYGSHPGPHPSHHTPALDPDLDATASHANGHTGADKVDVPDNSSGGGVEWDGAGAEAMNGVPAASAEAGGERQQQQQRRERERDRLQQQQLGRELGRLEMERRVHVEEALEMSERLQSLSAAQSTSDSYRASLEAAEERCRQMTAVADHRGGAGRCEGGSEGGGGEHGAQTPNESLQPPCARASAVRRVAQSASQSEALARYQELCAEAEERAIAAERRGGLAEARGGKMEVKIREMQGEAKASALQLATATQKLAAATARIVSFEAAAEAAAAAAQLQPLTDVSAQAAARLETVASLQAAVDAGRGCVAAAERELALCVARLEGMEARAQAAELRESRVSADLREAEAVLLEKEGLEAQVSALREKLCESRAERAQAEHYKQVCSELEVSRVRVDEELVSTAQLVTQLEARLQEALQRSFQAESAAQGAEARTRAAEAAVAAEVGSRMAAACHSRAMWPRALREEVGRVEARLEGLQAMLGAAQAESERQAEAAAAQGRMRVRAWPGVTPPFSHTRGSVDCQRRCTELEERGLRLEAARGGGSSSRHGVMEDSVQQLSSLLQDAQSHADALATAAAAAARHSQSPQLGSRSSSAANVPLPSPPHAPRSAWDSGGGGGRAPTGPGPSCEGAGAVRWQVQNRVGGGSLYGVADVAVMQPQPPQPSRASHSAAVLHSSRGHGDGDDDGDDTGVAAPSAAPHAPPGGRRLGASGGADTATRHPPASSGSLDLPASMTPGVTPASPRTLTTTTPSAPQSLHPSSSASTPRQGGGRGGAGGFFGEPAPTAAGAGVDIVYLKNVLLKFLEAHVTGRTGERDALLPAVAALLQASPAEFKVFKKVLANTNPASTQLWSVLGMGTP
ncbi:MAG: hypothetical protein WDW38_007135 [Sanguina aurantia]